MQDDNWDDLRFVLEVAEAGSVSAAARVLGVNASTVVRRVGAAETRFGVRFFERTAAGYTVPPDSLAVVAALREARDAIDGVSRHLTGYRGTGRGWVRVTSTDTLCLSVLPGIVAGLSGGAPDRNVELLVSNAHLDFARLHADIAVRPAPKLPEDMVGEAAATLRFGVYSARGAGTGGWIGLSGTIGASFAGQWMKAEVPDTAIVARADSFPAVRELVAAGVGKGMFPRILAEGRGDLALLEAETPDLGVPIWVACHADMAAAPRLKRVRADLAEALSAIADRL